MLTLCRNRRKAFGPVPKAALLILFFPVCILFPLLTARAAAPSGYAAEITHSGNGFTLVNRHSPERVDVEVTVEWKDHNDQDRSRPGSVSVTLRGGEDDLTSDIRGSGSIWKHSFTDLYRYSGGIPIEYALQGADAGIQYGTLIEKTDDYDFHVTLSRDPDLAIKVPVIVWDDDGDRDGLRPEALTLRIVADGEPTDITATVGEEDEWRHVFSDLEKNRAGEEIRYAFQVLESVDGYSHEFSDGGWTLTYTHAPALTGHSVTLIWDDEENQDLSRPPSVTMVLIADGQPTDFEAELSDDGEKAVFRDLYKKENGQDIVYTVRQRDVPDGYSVHYLDGTGSTKVTDRHSAETVDIPVRIIWDDALDQDGIRPSEITLRIGKNSDEYSEIRTDVTDEEVTEVLFGDLPANSAGEPVTYEIFLPEVPKDYEPGIIRNEDGSFDVILRHDPELTHLFAVVEWDDGDDIDGIRPDHFAIRLTADGEPTDLTAELPIYGSFAFDFRMLDMNREGEPVTYAVIPADPIPSGYELSGESTDTRLILVHVPEKEPGETIAKTVCIEWDDSDDFYGHRPDSVTVELLAYGEVRETVTVAKGAYDRWAHEFKRLPAYDSRGDRIVYSVREKRVDGYFLPEYTVDGFTVINRVREDYCEPERRVSVKKAAGNSGDMCLNGDIVPVTLWIRNTGRTALENVTVRDHIPAGTEYIEDSLRTDDAAAAFAYRSDGKKRIDGTIPLLPVNGSVRVRYSVRITKAGKYEIGSALFDFGNEEPLREPFPDPGHKSNAVEPCVHEKRGHRSDGGGDLVPEPEILPRTGFAPGIAARLPAQRVRYSTDGSLGLEIPVLGVETDIIGVPKEDGIWDVTWLGDKAGWLAGTALPGNSGPGNTVITGHVTDQFGMPGVFAGLGRLVYGDAVTVSAWGLEYTYLVERVFAVAADDTDVIYEETDAPVLTLMTCREFDLETGQYDLRQIVRCRLTEIERR